MKPNPRCLCRGRLPEDKVVGCNSLVENSTTMGGTEFEVIIY